MTPTQYRAATQGRTQMTTTMLYQAAVANIKTYWGVASHNIPRGDEIICHVTTVAGRSIVKKHYRTTWHLRQVDHEYSKQISRAKAAELLK